MPCWTRLRPRLRSECVSNEVGAGKAKYEQKINIYINNGNFTWKFLFPTRWLELNGGPDSMDTASNITRTTQSSFLSIVDAFCGLL